MTAAPSILRQVYRYSGILIQQPLESYCILLSSENSTLRLGQRSLRSKSILLTTIYSVIHVIRSLLLYLANTRVSFCVGQFCRPRYPSQLFLFSVQPIHLFLIYLLYILNRQHLVSDIFVCYKRT